MTLILSGTDGVSDIDGTAATPAIRGTDANTGIFFPAADTIAFAEGGVESARLNSSGFLGLGYSDPRGRLYVGTADLASGSTDASNGINLKQTSTTAATGIYIERSGERKGYYIYMGGASDSLIFQRNNAGTKSDVMALDRDGNVGIGVTPSATSSGTTSLEVKAAGSGFVSFGSVDTVVTSGAYYSSTGWRYAVSSLPVSTYYQQEGIHKWFTAASGTAGNAVTLTERARITSGGFFKQSNTGSYNDATNTFNEFNSDVSNNPCVTIRSTNASYAANSEEILPTRSATSSYSFYVAASGAGTDIEFKLRGDGNAYADGTWNNNGADYAEFFESANGEALTLGATVVLDGNKVREATSQDPTSAIIGVVRPKEPSKASMVVGNTAWNKWANKYLTDDFDRYIMEDHDVVEWEEQVLERDAVAAVEAVVDEEGNEVSPAVPAQEAVYKTKQHSYESHNIPAGVTVPADAVRKTHDDKGNKFQHYKLNPAWDKDAEYVNRENRPEWNIIGLLGQVKILKGQPVGDRWIKMRDVSATVEEWMIR